MFGHLNATIKCIGESAFRAYWISRSRKPIASIDFRDFFKKFSTREIGKDKVRIVWITWRPLCVIWILLFEKKYRYFVNMLNYVFHGWVDGRCMYFSIFWTTEGDMLLWLTNPVAACKDTFAIFWINLFVKIPLSAASTSSGSQKTFARLACLIVQKPGLENWGLAQVTS